MSQPPRPRRWFRPQISLRTMLVLTLLVGVGLTVYRWPWVEQSQHQIGKSGDIADYVRVSTYRRSWRGPPVKHGLEQVTRNKKVIFSAQFNEGLLNGPRRVSSSSGRLLWEAHYQAGKLHGPFRAGDGKEWFWEGEYFRNEPHGEWRFKVARNDRSSPLPPLWQDLETEGDLLAAVFAGTAGRQDKRQIIANPARRIQSWQLGRREGVWKTQTEEGDIISTAEYHDNEIYKRSNSSLGQREDWWEVDARRLKDAARKPGSNRQP